MEEFWQKLNQLEDDNKNLENVCTQNYEELRKTRDEIMTCKLSAQDEKNKLEESNRILEEKLQSNQAQVSKIAKTDFSKNLFKKKLLIQRIQSI